MLVRSFQSLSECPGFVLPPFGVCGFDLAKQRIFSSNKTFVQSISIRYGPEYSDIESDSSFVEL